MSEFNALQYARATDRSVLGSMRDQALIARHILENDTTPADLSAQLAETPCGPRNYESPERSHRGFSRQDGLALGAAPNYRVKLPSRRMVVRRPSRLARRFRTAARRLQAVMNIGQPPRRLSRRRAKPARSLREGRWADEREKPHGQDAIHPSHATFVVEACLYLRSRSPCQQGFSAELVSDRPWIAGGAESCRS